MRRVAALSFIWFISAWIPVASAAEGNKVYHQILEQLKQRQELSDPECKRAKSERKRFREEFSNITQHLCQMQQDKKKCFFEGVDPGKYIENVKPLTECESILALTILDMLDQQLKPVLVERHGKVPPRQPIVTMNTPTFGAFAIPIPNYDDVPYIVVFNRATFTTLLDLVKSMISIIPITDIGGAIAISYDEADIARELDRQPEILVRVAMQLANLIAGRGNLITMDTLPLNTYQLLLTVRTLPAIENFMLAHEYGHQHFQHKIERPGKTGADGEQDNKGSIFSTDYEMQADRYAQDILNRLAVHQLAKDPISALVTKSGGEIFLAVEGLLERARKAVGVKYEHSGRYPDRLLRAAILKEEQGKLRDSTPNLLQIDFGVVFLKAADVLWNRLADRWPLVYQAMNEIHKNSQNSPEVLGAN